MNDMTSIDKVLTLFISLYQSRMNDMTSIGKILTLLRSIIVLMDVYLQLSEVTFAMTAASRPWLLFFLKNVNFC